MKEMRAHEDLRARREDARTDLHARGFLINQVEGPGNARNLNVDGPQECPGFWLGQEQITLRFVICHIFSKSNICPDFTISRILSHFVDFVNLCTIPRIWDFASRIEIPESSVHSSHA